MATKLNEIYDGLALLTYANNAVAAAGRVCPGQKAAYTRARDAVQKAVDEARRSRIVDVPQVGLENLKLEIARVNNLCKIASQGKDASKPRTVNLGVPSPAEPEAQTEYMKDVDTFVEPSGSDYGMQQKMSFSTTQSKLPGSGSGWIWWLVGGGLVLAYVWKKKR